MTAVIAVFLLVRPSARNAAAVGLLPQGHSALDVSRSFRRSTYSSWPPTDSRVANYQTVIPVTLRGLSEGFRTSYARNGDIISDPSLDRTLCFAFCRRTPVPLSCHAHRSRTRLFQIVGFTRAPFCCPPRPIPPDNLCLARTTSCQLTTDCTSA